MLTSTVPPELIMSSLDLTAFPESHLLLNRSCASLGFGSGKIRNAQSYREVFSGSPLAGVCSAVQSASARSDIFSFV